MKNQYKAIGVIAGQTAHASHIGMIQFDSVTVTRDISPSLYELLLCAQVTG
jgi:hypothetical protein